ncbi:hypothetical protein FO519_001645 [Halicephalobus sp. NKZ332]|nr:hypothetical protein FO519_001645 [Halicephalobus sp. NKZ332]
MTELLIASEMKGTLRNPLVCMTLLGWHLIASYLVGWAQPDVKLCEKLIVPLSRDYPNGAIALFLKARLYLVKGDIENAIYFYGRSIEVQNVYKQFHHVCYWELLFAYSYLRKWDKAANHAKKLLDESKWSRCCYTYMLAMLIDADKGVPKREETVRYLLEKVPKLRLRIAGKSIPVEKFCEKKVLRYHRQGRLLFTHYEFMYFWNGFTILENNRELIKPILEDIEAIWKEEQSDDKDDYGLYLLLKGVSHRNLGELLDAEWCFLKILEIERFLTDYSYVTPNACFELAQTRKGMGRNDEVRPLLEKALSYRGYSLETKLHFRIHAAMENLENK